MGPSLRDLLDPAHTVLVTQECQRGVIGDDAIFPELAEAARAMIPNAGRLAKTARAARIPVVHCLALHRPDGLGAGANARLFRAAARSPVRLLAGSPAAEVVPEIGVEPEDVVLTRLHGLGPMAGTGLDPLLRTLGCRTVVGVGVSVNVGMTNFVMDAVNAGYRFVLPRDAVAGVPAAYAEAVLEHTLSLLATVVGSEEILDVWAGREGAGP